MPAYDPTKNDFLYAQSIGMDVLRYLRQFSSFEYAQRVDSEAVLLVHAILKILDDQTLKDPECFEQIEAIIDVYWRHGLRTTRHLEYE